MSTEIDEAKLACSNLHLEEKKEVEIKTGKPTGILSFLTDEAMEALTRKAEAQKRLLKQIEEEEKLRNEKQQQSACCTIF